ncbi:MAG: hypothetical protein IIC59_09385 [Proteobacteria bacterium]|nr:hypothetical protein [Pseudomonadota bacterium]
MGFRAFDANRDQKAVHRIWLETDFGLGCRDDLGGLTHFVWGERKEESGPYKVGYLAYRDREQFWELLALLKGLGDQIHCES